MKVYFVRHGESVSCAADIFQKDDDVLSEKGKEQVKVLAEEIKILSIDSFYSSPFIRAQETAEIISQQIGKPFEVWDNLFEARSPKEVVGKPLRDPEARKIKKLIKENYYKGNWKYSDEETFEELRVRGNEVVENLLKKPEKENVLCVSHAGIIKMIVTLMVFGDLLTPEIYWAFKYHMHSDHAGLTICKYSPNHGWWVNSWNKTVL